MKKISLNHLRWLTLSSMLILSITSCEKDNKDVSITERFFSNENYIFSFQIRGNTVEFFLDVLNDKSNAVPGTWPDRDTYRIYVDYNRNGVLDPDVDFLLSPIEDNSVCTAYLLSQTSTRTCSFFDGMTSEAAFAATDNSAEDHVSFRLTLPRDFLSNSNSTNVVIQLHDSETGWQRFPENDALFSNSNFFEINW